MKRRRTPNDGRYILHEFMRCIECVLLSVWLYEYAFRDNVSAVRMAAAAAAACGYDLIAVFIGAPTVPVSVLYNIRILHCGFDEENFLCHRLLNFSAFMQNMV